MGRYRCPSARMEIHRNRLGRAGGSVTRGWGREDHTALSPGRGLFKPVSLTEIQPWHSGDAASQGGPAVYGKRVQGSGRAKDVLAIYGKLSQGFLSGEGILVT